MVVIACTSSCTGGAEGGDGGGYVVAAGTPEEVVQIPESYTGQYLKSCL